MRSIYNSGGEKFRFVDFLLSVVFAAGYVCCVLPSFNNIGRLGFQVATALFLSACLTAAGLFFKNSLRFLGVALSFFSLSITAIGIYAEIAAQLEQEAGFKHWIYVFYYDKPLSAALVWGSAFLFVTLLRLCLPVGLTDDALARDYKRFVRSSSKGFFVFYGCFLLYGFFLIRGQGAEAGFNLIPFNSIQFYLTGQVGRYEGTIYLLGNLFCFMPLALFIRIYKPEKKTGRIIWLPVLISGLLEISQLLFRTGNCDIDDIILNSLGFYAGALFVTACNAFRKQITGGSERTIF